MILDKQTEGLILEEGEVQESTQMVIDQDSHQFLMRMLSKFYSDAIGSLIRETASNALDSHRECGVTDPIIVSFGSNNGNYEFSVEDFGCGIGTEEIKNIISKYGKSTKRQSTTQLGAFGLGFKSPLAYSSSFCFVGRKGGIERKWMMYEAEDEQNKIDLLYEKETSERNGVKVIVSVKWNDKSSFITKIKQQLAYFEGVYFNVEGINNDFTITRHEDFQHSTLCSDSLLHICLDNVYYPIDFSKLGISRLYIPLGLRFNLTDGIFPIPNRESLKYTEEAKKIILDKIKKLANFLVEKYNEGIEDTNSIDNIIEYYRSSSKYLNYLNQSIQLNEIKQYSPIPWVTPKMTEVNSLKLDRVSTMKDALLREYTKIYEFRGGRFTNISNNRYNRGFRYDDTKRGDVYVFEGTLSKHKKDYLREQLKGNYAYFVRKEHKTYLGKGKYNPSLDTYISILDLYSYPKNKWREIIKDWQYIQSTITEKFIDVDKIVIPQEWFDSKKKERVQVMAQNGTKQRRKKLSGEVTGRMLRSAGRYVSGKNAVLETIVFDLKTAHKQPYMVIYGDTSYDELFDKWFNLIRKEKVKFVIFSEREIKRLKDVEIHNWIKMEDFVKGEHIMFKRIITAYLINELDDTYSNVFNRRSVIKQVSNDIASKIEQLEEYRDKWYINADKDIYKPMLELAIEKKLFDLSIYSTYREIKTILDRLKFLNPLLECLSYDPEEPVISAIRDLFKYHRQRIDWQHYKLVLNEEVSEPFTEEKIEELI